jgi:DNA-binding CsgD family transcriptional regulator
MYHVIISLYVTAFIVGVLAAFYTNQIKKAYAFLYLRPLGHFILFFNLMILVLVVANYVKTNLQISSPNQLPLVYWIGDILISYIAAIGLTYSFLRVVRGLEDKRVSSHLRIGFAAGIIILASSYGAGFALYVQNDDFRWLYETRNAMYLAILLVPIMFLIILLIRGRKMDDADRRKIIRPFCYFYLSGFILLFLSLYFHFQFSPFDIALLLLFINLMPFIWFKWFFMKIYGNVFFLTEMKLILNKIADEHHISNREREILELILQGKTNKEIEDMLFISLSTVKNHIYNIYQKLGVKTRGQLVHLILEAQKKQQHSEE